MKPIHHNKTVCLVIVFNQFYPEKGTQYVEVTYDHATDSSKERTLARKPTAARFDKVFETGEGSYNQWNAHKAQRIFGYSLERK